MATDLHNLLTSNQTLVMGILNVTPDSFSDGGKFTRPETALSHVQQMLGEGAAIIDVGGESTRPGASEVNAQQELDRVIPVIEAIHKEFDVAVSIDTSKAIVMKEAVQAGANLVNDVRALREQDALDTVAELKVPVCLMHMQGQPRTMQANPQYNNVVNDVLAFLLERAHACEQAGIPASDIILDPGFGFGKTLEQNLSLFKHLDEFIKTGYPVLVGVSRKSMIGKLLDERDVTERVDASISLAGLAGWMGAKIIRAHDIRGTVDAIKMSHAVKFAQ